MQVDVNGSVRNNRLLSLYARAILTQTTFNGVAFCRPVGISQTLLYLRVVWWCSRERQHVMSSRETKTIRSATRVDQ